VPKARKRKGQIVAAATPRLQVAALCWRRSRKGLRILLVTSRDTGRWVIPKGWPMSNRDDSAAAAREAWEEAGLRGLVSERSIGLYTYDKALHDGRRVPVVVRVFPLEAREMTRRYPETGQRRVKWFDPEAAARKVAEPELKALIREFDPARIERDVAAAAASE
jgi:8-oxo-dGTP pyrophosphatase MutT (NUDIX family)